MQRILNHPKPPFYTFNLKHLHRTPFKYVTMNRDMQHVHIDLELVGGIYINLHAYTHLFTSTKPFLDVDKDMFKIGGLQPASMWKQKNNSGALFKNLSRTPRTKNKCHCKFECYTNLDLSLIRSPCLYLDSCIWDLNYGSRKRKQPNIVRNFSINTISTKKILEKVEEIEGEEVKVRQKEVLFLYSSQIKCLVLYLRFLRCQRALYALEFTSLCIID